MGTARINRAVIKPIKSSKFSTLHAVASRSLDKAAAYAHEWDIPKYHASYDALLDDPEIDVVYISLPNALHAAWSIKAMESGKHVLCEKPMTTEVRDMDEIISVSKKTGMIITEAFMYRHHPQTLLVKELVHKGEIGNLQMIKGSFCYTNTRRSDPRFELDLGGGCLWDVGCYPIGYARYIFGIEPICVFGSQITGPTGIDLLFVGQLQFPDNLFAQFDSSFISPFNTTMEIIGDKGKITVPVPFKPGINEKVELTRNGKKQIISVKGAELYFGEIEDMENAILSGQPTRISLSESCGNIATIESLYLSANKLKAITVFPN